MNPWVNASGSNLQTLAGGLKVETLGALETEALGRLRDGIAHLQRAVQLDPENADAHRYLGVQLLIQGNFARAEQLLRREAFDEE